MSLYNSNGQINTTSVSGSSYTGLHAADGSINIVINATADSWLGLYHPCGAYNAVVVTDYSSGFYAINGSVNVIAGNSPSGFVFVIPALVDSPFTGGINFTNGYPADSVTGVTLTLVAGVAALTSSWKNGPLFDLTLPNSSTITINAVGIGYPDVQSIANFIGINPRTGIGAAQISKWYNQQTGSPNSWVQAGSGSLKPMLYLIGGNVYVGFGGCLTRSDGGGITAPYFTSSASIDNNSFTAFAAVIDYSSTVAGATNSANYSTIFGRGSYGLPTGNDFGILTQGSYSGSFTVPPAVSPFTNFSDFTNNKDSGIEPNVGIQPQVVSVISGASSTTITANNTSNTGTTCIAGTTTGLLLGVDSSAVGVFSGRTQGFILSSSIFTSLQEQTMRQSLASWANINLNVNQANDLNIVLIGASSDIGQGSDPMGQYKVLSGGGYGYFEMLKDQYRNSSKKISWYNMAISGNTIADNHALWTAGVTTPTYQSSSAKNIIVMTSIDSHATIAGNGDDGTSAYNDFTSFLTDVKTKAWDAIAVEIYPPGTDTGISTFNNLIKTNAASLGIEVIDMTAQTNFFVPPTYANADGHPTIAGSQLWIPFMSAWIESHLA